MLVDRPDKVGRVQILNVHLKKARLAADVDPQAIAALTPGFTGADLANLVNEATLLATRRNAEAVAMQDFTAAIERIIAGLEKRNRLLNPREREIVAYHEMGHALVAMALPGVDPVHKVSIIPRGMGALGYTIQRPTEDRFLMTREELENKMAVLLGGRAAEWLVFAHLSTGAADDLAKVTDIARAMVTRYGMSTRLGHLALEREPNAFLGNEALLGLKPQHDYAESTATAIDEEVQELVQAAFQRSLSLLEARRELLERCARQLLQQETLDAEELRQRPPPRPGCRPSRWCGRCGNASGRGARRCGCPPRSRPPRPPAARGRTCRDPAPPPAQRETPRWPGAARSCCAGRPAPPDASWRHSPAQRNRPSCSGR